MSATRALPVALPATPRSAVRPNHPVAQPARPRSKTQQILALQRSHGNRFVADLMRRPAPAGRNALEPLPGVSAAGPGHVQREPRERPPMVFSGDTEFATMPPKLLFPGTTPFIKRWDHLAPTFLPLSGGTFIVDGIPISYGLGGKASASSRASLYTSPGMLEDVRIIVTGEAAEAMRRPRVILLPILPMPVPLVLPPDREPHGNFAADGYMRFSAGISASADAAASLEAQLGVFGNALNATAYAGLSGHAEASAVTNVHSFVEFRWNDGAVALSTVLDLNTAVHLGLHIGAHAGVRVELRMPEIPVVTELSHRMQDWPIVGWFAPDLSKWRWSQDYRKDWPLLEKSHDWNIQQRFTIGTGSAKAELPDADGFDMGKVLAELQGRQKEGTLKDDPEGAGRGRRDGDPAAVSAARAAALAQIGSAQRSTQREKKANSRLLAAARAAAAKAGKSAHPSAGVPAISLASAGGAGGTPADPVAQLEARDQSLDKADRSTRQLREKADALAPAAAAADGPSRNTARSGFEAIATNADQLGDKIDAAQEAFAIPPSAAATTDADYEKMQQAMREAYKAFDDASDPVRTEKLYADDQVRAAGTDPDLHPYRDAAYAQQIRALKAWERILALESDLERAREWYERHDHGLGAKVFDELRARARTIETEATALKAQRPVGDWDADHVELSEGHLMLRPQYRAKATRNFFYPHDYSSTTKDRMMREIGSFRTDDQGRVTWHFTGKLSARGDHWWLLADEREQPTLDHLGPTVVDHWNTQGRLGTYPARRSFYDFQGAALTVVPKTMNSSAGGAEKGSYTPLVTRAFRGAKT